MNKKFNAVHLLISLSLSSLSGIIVSTIYVFICLFVWVEGPFELN